MAIAAAEGLLQARCGLRRPYDGDAIREDAYVAAVFELWPQHTRLDDHLNLSVCARIQSMRDAISARRVAANDQPFAFQRGPFVDGLNSLDARGAIGQVDGFCRRVGPAVPSRQRRSRSFRQDAETLVDVRKDPLVIVSVFEISK